MSGAHAIEAETGAACARDDDQAATKSSSALRQSLFELEQLDASGLRQEWRRLFRSDPPQLSRDLVLRALAYRLQEREHGGLPKATLRRIAAQTRELRADGSERAEPSARVRPGARLVREWRGRTHTVTVTEDGFEYARKTYTSLTPIAKAITGAHWSGPRFFGLVRQHAPKRLDAAKPSAPPRVPPTAALSRGEVRHG